MKKYIYILLSLQLFVFTAGAQENKAVDVTLKGIQIGQQVPDVTITGLHNYKDAKGKVATTAKLSDFKGKLLILDFWATWCSPCVAMIPKMDSLQKDFGGKIQFLSVTSQNANEVISFMQKYELQYGKKNDLPIMTSSRELQKYFPHTFLPHYVWIDGSGKVVAITDQVKVNRVIIEKVLSGEMLSLVAKKDPLPLLYEKNYPLFLGNNGGAGEQLIYHSLLSAYTPGLGSGSSYLNKPSAGQKITARNLCIMLLYRLAYSDNKTYFGENRISYLVKDKSKLTSNATGTPFMEWMADGNGFCYELIVPKNLSGTAFSIMRRDLDQNFNNYKVQIEQLKKKCLVLTRTGNVDLLASKGGKPEFRIDKFGAKLVNTSLLKFVQALDRYYMQGSDYPIIDETGYSDGVDLQINFTKLNQQEVNISLEKYGLKFVLAERIIENLVFRDNHIVETLNQGL